MPDYFTEEWLKEYTARTGMTVRGGNLLHKGVNAAPEMPDARPSKYGNIKAEEDGEIFDSRHEAKCWRKLKLRQRAGEFTALGRQVIFQLPGGVRYIADFVGITPEGKISVMDAKSEATRKDKAYSIKKRLMKHIGYEIEEL